MSRVFISHASKDEEIIKAFIDDILIGSLSVKISDIFCTTTDGTKIKSGEDWRNAIRDHLLNAKITFIIITPNYKESEVCLSEMGAAWVCSGVVIPLIVEPINYESVGIIQQPKQIEKLMDESSLDRIKDVIQEALSISSKDIKSDRWTAKKKEFLIKLKKNIKENPFALPLDRKTFDKLQKDNVEINSAFEEVVKEKIHIEKVCADLKKLKNKDEVKKVEKKHGVTSAIDEFQQLCNEVHKRLSQFDNIIIGIIFKSYSGKDISINWRDYDQEISNAVARDYISDELEVEWSATPAMRAVENGLSEVSSFIAEHDIEPSFVNAFDEKYDVPLDLRNMDFWEKVFEVNIQLG